MDTDFASDIPDKEQSTSTPKQQVIERLRGANNVLVTVKSDPSVDELAAIIGLTLMLNKLEKHTTAVFSGEIPSTLEFLRPDETIETNTDSLRDFIVSLDKSKADKLRYKVEENVVKIFITPYRTSISESDLEFTQGDFNVDVVVALGVTKREELDNAITAHGRILHDATFITVTAGSDYSELGQVNWQDQGASSLSEMLVSISEAFQTGIIDTQIATAFLTGIVAETARFSNPKTTPKVMTMSAQLMAAGANQQLIANELEKATLLNVDHPQPSVEGQNPTNMESSDGTLSISHSSSEVAETKPMNLEAPDTQTNDITNSTETQSEAGLTSQSQTSIPTDVSSPPLMSPFEQVQSTAADVQQPSTSYSSPMLPELGQQVDSNSRLYSTESNDKPVVEIPVANGDSQAGGVLPPLENINNNVVPPTNPADITEADASITIDKEGNIVRNNAIQPKHKVIHPLEDNNLPRVDVSQLEPDSSMPSNPPANPLPPPPSAQVIQSTPPVVVAEPASMKANDQPIESVDIPIEDSTTLEEIEKAVNSPHVKVEDESANIDEARNAVFDALGHSDSSAVDAPRSDLNAMPLSAPPDAISYDTYRLPDGPAVAPQVNDVTGNVPDSSLGIPSSQPKVDDSMSPPPVPPPILPPNQVL